MSGSSITNEQIMQELLRTQKMMFALTQLILEQGISIPTSKPLTPIPTQTQQPKPTPIPIQKEASSDSTSRKSKKKKFVV